MKSTEPHDAKGRRLRIQGTWVTPLLAHGTSGWSHRCVLGAGQGCGHRNHGGQVGRGGTSYQGQKEMEVLVPNPPAVDLRRGLSSGSLFGRRDQ